MTPSFSNFGLSPLLLKNVKALGYREPTPIQLQAIDPILQGRDVLAAAQTGTGKTAAFGLPLVEKLLQGKAPRKARSAHALILAPTRELAAQIEEDIRGYALGTGLKTALVFGGVNIRPQTAALGSGVDILVATPGRLLDHIGQGNVSLSNVHFLVLDEADRMLDMGFIRDIRKILAVVPKRRQTLLFSATFNDDIHALAQSILNHPVDIEIAKNQDCALVRQEVYFAAKKGKRDLLRDLIVDNNWEQVLVFTRMKHAANRLAEQLAKDGLTSAAIHGNKSQSARTKALSGFKNKTIRVLVATDIAARGLDIKGLPQVVNYELPNVPEDYVHRIGRTGRAGQAGLAISLVSPEETSELKAVERLLKKKLTVKNAPSYENAGRSDLEETESTGKPTQRKSRQGRKRSVQAGSQKATQRPEKAFLDKKPQNTPAKTFGEKPASVRWERASLTGKKAQSETGKPKARKKDTLGFVARQTKRTLQKDLRFETVRSNLPPGMPILRLKRRRS